MVAIVPGADYRQLPASFNTEHFDYSLGLVLHVQAGNGDPYGWFEDPSHGASSHWWVSKTGRVVQYLDPDNHQGWTQADGNAEWHSVETEGFPDEPLTPAQVSAVARIYRWGMGHFGWPAVLSEAPSTKGLGWHGMGGGAWGGHVFCPGELRKGQRSAILAEAVGRVTPAVVKPVTPAPSNPMKGDGVSAADVSNAFMDANGPMKVHRDDAAHGIPAQTISLRDDIVMAGTAARNTDFNVQAMAAEIAALKQMVQAIAAKVGA